MIEWQDINTRPKPKQSMGYLIAHFDMENGAFDNGIIGANYVEWTFGYVGPSEEGKERWWNMNSGNMIHFRQGQEPTHWAPTPFLNGKPTGDTNG